MPTLEQIRETVPNLQTRNYTPAVPDREIEKAWTGKEHGANFNLSRVEERTSDEVSGEVLMLRIEGRKGKKRLISEFTDALGSPTLKGIGFDRETVVVWDLEPALNNLSPQQPQ